MKRRYKIVLNVEVEDPDKTFPAGGDYTHLDRINGIAHSLVSSHSWYGFTTTISLDKIIDKGEIEESKS
jgi:hypothetical protein